MTLRKDGRVVVSATMQPELYDRMVEHCQRIDAPLTVFIREAIRRALPADQEPEPEP